MPTQPRPFLVHSALPATPPPSSPSTCSRARRVQFKPAEVKLQAESIAQQRYVGAPAGDIVVPEVTPTAAQAAASADAAVFVESDMPAPEREEAIAPPEDSVQTGDQTNPGVC